MKAWCLVAIALLVAGSAALATAADVDELLSGVDEVVAPGALVGQVAVFGEQAFPVLTGQAGKNRLPIIAAARWGQGRVLVGAHEALFGHLERPAQAALATNVVRWLAKGKAGATVLLHGHRGWEATLRAAGFNTRTVETAGLAAALPTADVVLAAGGQFDQGGHDELVAALQKWIQDGGGYFDAIPIWGWMQVTRRTRASEYGTNRVVAKAGLLLTDGSVEQTGKEGWVADKAGFELSNANEALRRLTDGGTLTADEQAKIGAVLTSAAGALPDDDQLLLPALHNAIAGLGGRAVPSAKQPLGLDAPLARLAVVLENQSLRRTAPTEMPAHPAAATFPGSVPAEAPRVERVVSVDTSVPDWASTGLYAAPGEVVEVVLPEGAEKAGLGLRIGAHTDTLWGLDKWTRFPEISYAVPLKATRTKAANPFGGPVYVTVPHDSKLGVLPVTIVGAVEMPLFVQGRTSLYEWRTRLRSLAAPWAELATSKIILTVPAEVVRNLDDPESLLYAWDGGLDAIADLGGTPRVRTRPERIVTDQQISAGYMHSGYPIMTWLDVPPVMVDRDKVVKGGASTMWGFWHELGHNHQAGWWTFDGTGEVTNNLFSLYCCERVSDELVPASSWLNTAKRNEAVTKYFAEGAPFDRWKSDPGLALMMYAQLQQAFGWGAYQRVLAGYRAATEAELPKSDADKRDQWMVRFSRAVGRNLGPFFVAWGVPTSQAARDSIADLPTWLPKDLDQGIPFSLNG